METKLKIEKQDLNASPITEEHSLFFGKVFRGKSAYQYAVDSGLFSGTEEEFAQYLGNIHNVTEDANEATAAAIVATEGATQATMEAREAKEAADSATARATQATAGATTATENAIQATANTNEAIAHAEQATADAEVGTEKANEAAYNANNAAQRANEEVENLRDKADIDKYYPLMSVGMADNLVGRGDVQDAQINFRPSGGDPEIGGMNITDGAARIERIKGNSVVYNQQFYPIANNGWSVSYPTYASGNLSDGAIRVTVNDGVTIANVYQVGIRNNKTGIHLHRYLIRAKVRISAICAQSNYNFVFEYSSNSVYMQPAITTPNEWVNISLFFDGKENSSANLYIKPPLSFYKAGGDDWYEVKDATLIDLTQMFGADNEPTTVEEYYQRKPMNIKDEFAYNKGELIDMKVDALISTSDNAYDSENGYARVMGGVPYTITIDNRKDITPEEVVFATNAEKLADDVIYPNADGTYTFPSNGYANASFMGAGIGKKDTICICLKHSYDKPHPPYQQKVKDLSFISEAFPNGMRSAGSAYDEIRFNPTAQRWEKVTRIGAVDLGSLTWQYKEAYQCFCSVENYFIPLGKGTTSTYILNNVAASALSDRQFSFHTSLGIGKILIKDLRYTDAQTFKNELQGVLLNYELAEPIVEPTPLSPNLNLDYPVWDFGTEEAMASVPSAPFRADINYEPNAVDDLRWAVAEIRNLKAQLAQMSASVTNLTE